MGKKWETVGKKNRKKPLAEPVCYHKYINSEN